MKFNHSLIKKTIAFICFIQGIAMMIPALWAFLTKDVYQGRVFLFLGLGLLLVGATFVKINIDAKVFLKIRESYFMVLTCWLAVIVIGTLPYLFSGCGFSFFDCLFQSAASWTTTSSWAININSMAESLVLWKAMCNWMGGVGVIFLAVMFFTSLGVYGKRMFTAEAPTSQLHSPKARMVDLAKTTYLIYGGITLLELVLFLLGGMPFFTALINALSSISTAGILDYGGQFSLHFTIYTKIVLIVFSLIASLNFVVLIKFFQGRFKWILKDRELHYYLGIIVYSSFVASLAMVVENNYNNFWDAVTNSILGVVSYSSTSGFVIPQMENWHSVTKFILVILMIIGGCSNSTCGGIKVIRFSVVVEIIKRGIYKAIHPRSTKPIKIGENIISANNVSAISSFTLLFFGAYLVSVLVFSFENLDMETTLTAPLALLTNTGTGFGLVAKGDFSFFSSLTKIYGSIIMLAGRLELYAIIIVFSRSFWNGDRAKTL